MTLQSVFAGVVMSLLLVDAAVALRKALASSDCSHVSYSQSRVTVLDMGNETETVVIMRGPHAELERVVATLAERGIESAIVCPDEKSGSS